jgi:hypothetical protein
MAAITRIDPGARMSELYHYTTRVNPKFHCAKIPL